MDEQADRELLWIAREGLTAPLPKEWKPCKTTDTNEIYYFNFQTGESTWDHPCDDFYRGLYKENKQREEKRRRDDAMERRQQLRPAAAARAW